MPDNLDKPNRLRVHHRELYQPFPPGQELRSLFRLAVRMAVEGCNNVYVLRHVLRLIADVRAPGVVSNKELEGLTWNAVDRARWMLTNPRKQPARRVRLNVKTELVPSEHDLAEARRGKPLVSQRTVEVYVRRPAREK